MNFFVFISLLILFGRPILMQTVQYTLQYANGTKGYQLITYTSSITWATASQIAQQKGGQLASFESVEEYKEVFNNLISATVNPNGWFSSTDFLTWKAGPYIGGYRVSGTNCVPASFRWLSTSSPIGYTSQWRSASPAQPDCSSGTQVNSGIILAVTGTVAPTSFAPGYWTDCSQASVGVFVMRSLVVEYNCAGPILPAACASITITTGNDS
jgi:hypothetical protein